MAGRIRNRGGVTVKKCYRDDEGGVWFVSSAALCHEASQPPDSEATDHFKMTAAPAGRNCYQQHRTRASGEIHRAHVSIGRRRARAYADVEYWDAAVTVHRLVSAGRGTDCPKYLWEDTVTGDDAFFAGDVHILAQTLPAGER